MNIWKYICVKFYEVRRDIVGKTLGEEVSTVMLFKHL